MRICGRYITMTTVLGGFENWSGTPQNTIEL